MSAPLGVLLAGFAGLGSAQDHQAEMYLPAFANHPGFTIVAILTLALGVGGTTAIFSAVNAVVLRPVPVAEPDRLVYVFSAWRDLDRSNVSPGNFWAWQERNSVYSSIAAMRFLSLNLTEGLTPERVVVARVTGDLFKVLGVNPSTNAVAIVREGTVNVPSAYLFYPSIAANTRGDFVLCALVETPGTGAPGWMQGDRANRGRLTGGATSSVTCILRTGRMPVTPGALPARRTASGFAAPGSLRPWRAVAGGRPSAPGQG